MPTAVAGEPYESWHVISDDGRVELGIWEVTPGSFRGETDGIYEQMHFVAGSGTITDADGVVTDIRPGVVMLCPDGWSGIWDVSRDDPQDVRGRQDALSVIDPLERWRELGLPDKPDYAVSSRTRACRTRRTRPSSRASTSRSSARRPTTSSPTGRGRASGRARSAPRAVRPGHTSRPRSTRSRSSASSTSATPRSLPADSERTHAADRAHRRPGR